MHGRLLSMPARSLACWLPQLGGVLCLSPRAPGGPPEPPAAGLLVEDAGFAPLHRVCWLYAASAVTADGPREWADAIDARGRACARIYLLPGTDYCAWDAMLCTPLREGVAVGRPPAFRAAGARLLRFRHRRLAGMEVLGAEACAMDRLDLRVAAEIVRHEAVALRVPMVSG